MTERGDPIGALARHAAIEHVGQPSRSREFRTLDQNACDRRTDGAETEEGDLQRARSGLRGLSAPWLSARGFRLLGLWASRHPSTVYKAAGCRRLRHEHMDEAQSVAEH